MEEAQVAARLRLADLDPPVVKTLKQEVRHVARAVRCANGGASDAATDAASVFARMALASQPEPHYVNVCMGNNISRLYVYAFGAFGMWIDGAFAMDHVDNISRTTLCAGLLWQ